MRYFMTMIILRESEHLPYHLSGALNVVFNLSMYWIMCSDNDCLSVNETWYRNLIWSISIISSFIRSVQYPRQPELHGIWRQRALQCPVLIQLSVSLKEISVTALTSCSLPETYQIEHRGMLRSIAGSICDWRQCKSAPNVCNEEYFKRQVAVTPR